MKYRRNKEYATLDLSTRFDVMKRDNRKCVLCGSQKIIEIHEIIPRSQFGNQDIEKLFSLKNRCVICRKCHSNKRETRIKIMEVLRKRHGYNYRDYPWSIYNNESNQDDV